MDLTREEEAGLDGKYGEATSIAYNILWSVGQLTEAKRLIDISSAHVSGVAYNTIGDAGLKFLSSISESGKFSVHTTVNPTGMDLNQWKKLGIDPGYAEKQQTIVAAYLKLGAIPSFTCLPYEGVNVPKKGSHVSWAETSAAIYANSILGLKTNRESALTALASAITGKIPLSDFHKTDALKPNIIIKVHPELTGTLDYGLLGYYAGRVADEGPIGFEGIKSIKNDEAKSLSAGLGTTGASGTFLLDYEPSGVEKVSFTSTEKRRTRDDLSRADQGDNVVLGCPHYSLAEITQLYKILKGRKFTKRCLIFCSRYTFGKANDLGLIGNLTRAGCEFVCDSCPDFTPLMGLLDVDTIVTDSCKGCHYIHKQHSVDVALMDTNQIVEENCK